MSMKIVGLSAFYHDSAAALIIDGEIVAAAQEERFTRKKGDESFPAHALRWILESQKLQITDIDAFVYYEKPWWTFERIIETHLQNAPRSFSSFAHAMPLWLKQKLNIRALLRKELSKAFGISVPREKIFFSAHHLSHASSAFFPSPFSSAAVLCVDGVGEWATASIWKAEDNRLTPLWELRFPHSLGLFYSAMTAFCGFKVNSGEYKLMGLAPFGQPRYLELLKKHVVKISETDGGFELDMKYFNYTRGLTMFTSELSKLLQVPAREFESDMPEVYKDIAASVQALTNEVMLMWARKAKELTQSEYLCLSGGVALNCVANGKILESGLFKDIWIQPAAGDAGSSVGAALAYWHLGLQKLRTAVAGDNMHGAFLGPRYSEFEIERVLKEKNLNYKRYDQHEMCVHVAKALNNGAIISWFQDEMEFGPRALGHRSILGDPRNAEMKTTMNLKIKFREGFRPFAPIVLEENLHDVFEMTKANPYMLIVGQTKSTWNLPAITHVDGSARVQTIDRFRHPLMHQLMSEFKNLTGCPVLINTSLNVRGEPLVNSPIDAVNCFLNTDIDILVAGPFVAEKKQQSSAVRDTTWRTRFELD
jgi:carbamoyltransferase